MKKDNHHILKKRWGKLTALLLAAGMLMMPAMSGQVYATQDGEIPEGVPAVVQETVIPEQVQQTPLTIQQETLQEMQQGIALQTLQGAGAQVTQGMPAEDVVTQQETAALTSQETQAATPQEIPQESVSDSTQNLTQEAAGGSQGVTPEDLVCYGAKVMAGSKGLYSIRINRDACTVTIYQNTVTGETIPFRSFICSASRWTPTGQFSLLSKIGWSALAGGVYGQYCMPITGPYWFHSVPYYSANEDDLEYEEFNKLGQNVSLGCVRLMVQDVKWIFDNCDIGTPVEIYDDISDPGPLGQPEPIRIDLKNKKRGWDPTDPHPENPWTMMEVLEYNRDDKPPVKREDGIMKDIMCRDGNH